MNREELSKLVSEIGILYVQHPPKCGDDFFENCTGNCSSGRVSNFELCTKNARLNKQDLEKKIKEETNE